MSEDSKTVNPYVQRLLNSEPAKVLKLTIGTLRERNASLPETISSDGEAEEAATLSVRGKEILKPVDAEAKAIKKEIKAVGDEVSDALEALTSELSGIIKSATAKATDYAIAKAESMKAEALEERKARRAQARIDNAEKINELSAELGLLMDKLRRPETSPAQVLALSRSVNKTIEDLDALGVDVDNNPDVARMQKGGAAVSGAGVSITTRDVYSFEVVSEADVPREYLMIDEAKIRAAVAKDPNIQIPGIRVTKDTRGRINARG